jgi:hypothetical protein
MTADITVIPKEGMPKSRTQYRMGIGEWYGRSFADLTGEERKYYASIQLTPKKDRPAQPCPFLSTKERTPCR